MKASLAADLPLGIQRDILKSIRIPLAIIDAEFRFLWLNQEMARIYQTQPEQATGKICYQLASGQAQPCHDCPVATVQKSGRREISQKYKDFNGVRKYGEVSAFPVFGAGNKMVATLLMVIDITDKIVVNMNDAYRQLAQWMPAVLRMAKLPPDAKVKEQPQEKDGQTGAASYGLTRRETHVLRLLAKGQSNTQIAARLEISSHTVKSHVIHIFNKLGVNDRIQAAVMATKQRIID
jgi:PAS domain S-box-containing protein